jgi:hypothetical protein
MGGRGMMIRCFKCGKKIIRRLDNGDLEFVFGRDPENGGTPVRIIIRGTVELQCLRRTCRQVNKIASGRILP